MSIITIKVKTMDGTLLEVSYDKSIKSPSFEWYPRTALKNAIEALDPLAYPVYRIKLFRLNEDDIDELYLKAHNAGLIPSEYDMEHMSRNQDGDTIGMLLIDPIIARFRRLDTLYHDDDGRYHRECDADYTYILQFSDTPYDNSSWTYPAKFYTNPDDLDNPFTTRRLKYDQHPDYSPYDIEDIDYPDISSIATDVWAHTNHPNWSPTVMEIVAEAAWILFNKL